MKTLNQAMALIVLVCFVVLALVICTASLGAFGIVVWVVAACIWLTTLSVWGLVNLFAYVVKAFKNNEKPA